MVYLSKKEAEMIISALSKTNDDKITKIVNKIKLHPIRPIYARSRLEIKALLKKAFKERKKVRINYYSLSSDEVTNRIIDIYRLHSDCVVAYCNLREEESTFVINRINKVALLDKKYEIPKNWVSESVIFNK